MLHEANLTNTVTGIMGFLKIPNKQSVSEHAK